MAVFLGVIASPLWEPDAVSWYRLLLLHVTAHPTHTPQNPRALVKQKPSQKQLLPSALAPLRVMIREGRCLIRVRTVLWHLQKTKKRLRSQPGGSKYAQEAKPETDLFFYLPCGLSGRSR